MKFKFSIYLMILIAVLSSCSKSSSNPTQPTKSITVISPNGGENYICGDTIIVTWSSENISAFDLKYSLNAGTTWVNVANDILDTTYSLPLPDTISTNCLVRVSGHSDSSYFDVSDSTFSIVDKTILVITPNGGETYNPSDTVTVSWYSNYSSNYDVYFSTDNGNAWSVLAANTPNTTYQWIIPDIYSTQCLIQVIDQFNSSINDRSDSCFTIVSQLNPPANFTIQATNDGLGIICSWDAVAGIDSYEVQTPDQNYIIDNTQTTYTHNTPANMGTYRVRAYRNNLASDWSDSATTSPISGSNQMGEWSHSSFNSCFYWGADGNGHSISHVDPNAVVLADVFLHENINDLYIFSANENPLGGNKFTPVAYESYVSPYAPATNWYNGCPCSVSGCFWLELESGNYVRLVITTLNTWDITFSWLYQPVEEFRFVE